MYGYVYKTTNLINGRCYIGQKKAIEFIPTYLGSGKIIKLAIKRYGKDSFRVELIAQAHNKKSLDILERYYIEVYRRELGSKLYNICDGGRTNVSFSGNQHTEEVKKRLRLINSGVRNPMFGKQHTSETRKRISLIGSGENNPNYGKHLSEEIKEKLRLAQLGKRHSEETRMKISLANSRRVHSEETKRKIRLSELGEKNHFYGRRHSKESRVKVGLSVKDRISSGNIVRDTNTGRFIKNGDT